MIGNGHIVVISSGIFNVHFTYFSRLSYICPKVYRDRYPTVI